MKRITKYESTSTCIRAIDLIKIANQLYNDKMEFVHIAITNSNDEDLDGSVQIHAIPSIDSTSVKEYPRINRHSLADFSDLIV